jgi:DNA-directed RNA polymerase specialized sigma24 family protein
MNDRSSQTQHSDFSQLPLADIIAHCQEERRAYRLDHAAAAPWSMELFRRAFAADQEAWQALRALFEPLVRGWIGSQRCVEYEDVLQETFLAFARYAPRHPELIAEDEPGRVLTFLRRCAKTALLNLLRQRREAESLNAHAASTAVSDDFETREALRERLKELLQTEEERRVFHWRFECDMKPKQIVASYSHQFSDVTAIYEIIQRINRRLRKDPRIRALYGAPANYCSERGEEDTWIVTD